VLAWYYRQALIIRGCLMAWDNGFSGGIHLPVTR
jgi:hypothetical protein